MGSEFWMKLILAILGSSGFMSILGLIIQRYWAKKDKAEAQDNAVLEEIRGNVSEIGNKLDLVVANQQIITIDRVKYLGRTFIRAGEISLEDKQNLKLMYDSHKDLGGNGDLDTVMEEIAHLPVKG